MNDIPDLTRGKLASLVVTHSNASNFKDFTLFQQNKHHLGRQLDVNKTSLSHECHDCQDAGNNYCPRKDPSQGYCCSPDETCPRVDYCTKDSNLTMKEVNYYQCPNEVGCIFTKVIVPPSNGT